MKKLKLLIISVVTASALHAQAVKEYVEKNGVEKIRKQVAFTGTPITANSYDDGHGRNPYLTSESQIPDTLALITFYIIDNGVEVKSGNTLYSYSLSEKGGNYVANNIHKANIDEIKAAYKKIGVVVLTPEEYLNTEEKRKFYLDFQPKLSKLGKFLTGLENRAADVAVAADYYRGFDLSAATDHERMASLGYELANKLGVDGVLSISFEVASDKKEVNLTLIRTAIHAPNPIAKQDKKYISQNLGAGYYEGQLYVAGHLQLKSALLIAEIKKGQILNENYEGIGALISCIAEESDAEIRKAIAKNSK